MKVQGYFSGQPQSAKNDSNNLQSKPPLQNKPQPNQPEVCVWVGYLKLFLLANKNIAIEKTHNLFS